MTHKKPEMLKAFRTFLIFSAFVLATFLTVKAEEPIAAGVEPAVEKFNASKLIMEHIADSY